MPDYLPKFAPGETVTRTASATIVGGQMVVITGTNTVGPSAGANAAWFGVAAHNAAVGEPVTVFKGGIQRPLATGAVAAGDILVTAANGRLTTNAAPAAGQQVGIAIAPATDGNPVLADFLR